MNRSARDRSPAVEQRLADEARAYLHEAAGAQPDLDAFDVGRGIDRLAQVDARRERERRAGGVDVLVRDQLADLERDVRPALGLVVVAAQVVDGRQQGGEGAAHGEVAGSLREGEGLGRAAQHLVVLVLGVEHEVPRPARAEIHVGDPLAMPRALEVGDDGIDALAGLREAAVARVAGCESRASARARARRSPIPSPESRPSRPARGRRRSRRRHAS